MRSAFRQVCLTFLWLLACANALSAQNPANNKPAASVQGRVLVEGAPQAGVIVMLTSAPEGAADIFTAAPAPTAVTDGAGRYRFAQVAAGKYRLKVHAPTYFVDASGEDRLTVSEAEMVENYDINLKRGGVIVGKVLDGDDQPRIEELVELSLLDEEGRAKTFQSTGRLNMTDDRGVFRIFGLTPGNYRVSAGRAEQMAGFFNGQAEYQRTFYPSTTEEAEAKLVAVRAGAETEGIEIVLARANAEEKKGFTVSGRIINAETNQPIAGTMVMLMPNGETTAAANAPTMPANSDGKGEFQFNHVAPGDYTAMLMNLQAMMTGGATGYAESLSVSVKQADVSGLEIKLKSGATLSGTVALDAKANAPKIPSAESPLANLMIVAMPERGSAAESQNQVADSMGGMFSGGMAMVKPDQTFALAGLRPGKYSFRNESLTGKKLQLARIERNGAVVAHIEVTGAEPITGVRLIFSAGTATLIGRVQVQGATLPTDTHFSIAIERQGPDKAEERIQFTESDKRGTFSLAGLTPGAYELKVTAVRTPNEVTFQYEFPTQTIVLADNASHDVVLYVNVVKKENR